MKNNLAIINTGLDHVFLNGIPIVELAFTIEDILREVGRVTSLAVQADPYFNDKTNAQKLFSEIHGSSERTAMDFILRAAKDISPIFIPFQRQIPEGVPATKAVEYALSGAETLLTWPNPLPSSSLVTEIQLNCTAEAGDLDVIVNGSVVDTISLSVGSPKQTISIQGFNYVTSIELDPSNVVAGFKYDVTIKTSQFNAIGWVQALTKTGDVLLPASKDDIRISNLKIGYTWTTLDQLIKVTGAFVRLNSGSAYVTVVRNGVAGDGKLFNGGPIY